MEILLKTGELAFSMKIMECSVWTSRQHGFVDAASYVMSLS